MTISSIGGPSAQQLVGTAAPAAPPGHRPAGFGPPTVTNVSDAAKTLSRLNELKSTDPEAFRAELNSAADDVRSHAAAQGGRIGELLNAFADKLSEAAKTGDLSVLQPPDGAAGVGGGRPPFGGPPGGGPPGGGPPGGGPGGAVGGGTSKSSSASSGTKDPADTNGDGVVSALERLVYQQGETSTGTTSQSDATATSTKAHDTGDAGTSEATSSSSRHRQ